MVIVIKKKYKMALFWIFLNQLLVWIIFVLDKLNSIPEGYPTPPNISIYFCIFAILFIVPLRSIGFSIIFELIQ